MFRPFLLSISIFCASSLPALAQDDILYPRVEAGGKLGTERSLGTGEYWVPLSQGHDRVLYGDLRFMADDAENNEGNLGIGYRQIVEAPVAGQAIAGAHVWADRRRSARGNVFYQTAAGVELMGRDWDARANAYIPLSGDKTRTSSTANGQSSDPYLAGSGIYYDTGGQTLTTVTEEPQPGFDLELGVRVPVFEEHMDAVRLYGGGYHFMGDKTEDVTGWRARLVADVTPSFSIGGRFQKDDARGSQGFLEATIRFPFEAKKSFREEGLRARLDESPERDVDIVTGAAATRSETYGQQGVAVLAAATGNAQRILHVDNTAATGGDGSKERPFNTLNAAEAAMQPYDVIYVDAGDGTTTGQDEGIVIDEVGVSLIGSGTNFVYDTERFTSSTDTNFAGTVLAKKTVAPILKNTEATTDVFTGVGVYVVADKAYISGIEFDASTTGANIFAYNNGGQWEGITVNEVTTRSLNHARDGIRIQAINSGRIEDTTITQVTTNEHIRGINVSSDSGGEFGNVLIDNVYAFSASQQGVLVGISSGSGSIDNIRMQNIESYENGTGVMVNIQAATGAVISNALLSNITANNNSTNIRVSVSSINEITNLQIDNVKAENNNLAGIYGLYIQSASGGVINTMKINSFTSTGNIQTGMNVISNANSSISALSVQNSAFYGNVRDGIVLNDDTTGTFNVDLGGGTTGSAGSNSIYGNGTGNPATYRDMRLDLDGGVVSAQHNWWGQAGGPTAGRIVNEGACPNCGTVNTLSPLDHNPNL